MLTLVRTVEQAFERHDEEVLLRIELLRAPDATYTARVWCHELVRLVLHDGTSHDPPPTSDEVVLIEWGSNVRGELDGFRARDDDAALEHVLGLIAASFAWMNATGAGDDEPTPKG